MCKIMQIDGMASTRPHELDHSGVRTQSALGKGVHPQGGIDYLVPGVQRMVSRMTKLTSKRASLKRLSETITLEGQVINMIIIHVGNPGIYPGCPRTSFFFFFSNSPADG